MSFTLKCNKCDSEIHIGLEDEFPNFDIINIYAKVTTGEIDYIELICKCKNEEYLYV